MIEFKNVTKAFGERVILDELNLVIPKGQVTVIIGKSGEGKSVTIKHIMGLLKPTRGEVWVNGEHISIFDDDQLREYRKTTGMLFQHAALFDSMTVLDNVLFPLVEHTAMAEAERLSRARQVLSQVGLPDIETKYPDQLSTGEKKRVGLARALVHKPRLILYDEPTTGMDPLVSEMIDNLIIKVNKEEPDLTSIVISHDLKAALEVGQQLVMIYKGRVQLAGSPEDFKTTADPVVRQFFSGQVEGPMEFL